jgi:hypothetical protein
MLSQLPVNMNVKAHHVRGLHAEVQDEKERGEARGRL